MISGHARSPQWTRRRHARGREAPPPRGPVIDDGALKQAACAAKPGRHRRQAIHQQKVPSRRQGRPSKATIAAPMPSTSSAPKRSTSTGSGSREPSGAAFTFNTSARWHIRRAARRCSDPARQLRTRNLTQPPVLRATRVHETVCCRRAVASPPALART